MSDDSFIREVNEQIRQERLQTIWRRFGRYIIAAVVVAVLATIAFVVWEQFRAQRAAADGDRYFAAVDLAETGDTAGAVAAFEALVDDGVGAYPHLARLRIASTLAAEGDRASAVERLDEVASSSAPQPLRDVAAVRAGYLLVDDGTPDDVRQRVERLTNEASALRHPAREALGLSLWRAGDSDGARPFFQQITEDLSAPAGIAQRARLMIEIIDGGSALPEPGTVPPTPAPEDAAPAPDAPVAAAPDEPQAGPVDEPAAPVEADPTLTTPLAEQLDLPEADGAAPREGEPQPAATPSPDTSPAEPVAPPPS